MTISVENTATNTKPQIHIKRVYQHPIDRVWNALTTKEALSAWLMETQDFELKRGHQFQLKTKPQGSFDGIVNCEITDFSQPNMLSYTWTATAFVQPTTVTWELKSLSETETLLTLSHTGFKGWNGWLTRQILTFGWKSLLRKKLQNYLAI